MTAVDSPTNRPLAVAGGATDQMPAARRPRRRRRNDSRVAWLLSAPTLLVLAALLAYPLYRMIVLSFQNMRLRELLTGLTPPWVGFEQYQKALTDSTFWGVV